MPEHPWPADPACILNVPDDPAGWGWLTYLEPTDGRRASLPVTRGPSQGPSEGRPTTWHVETPEPGVAVTRPSIKVTTTRPDGAGRMREVELYHSPLEVRWRVVDDLEG